MKDAISVNIRWLSVFVGFFGFWCLLRAAVCVYFFIHFDVSPESFKYLSADTISVVKHAHYGLVVSVVVFAFVALISGVSAYGIYKHRNWASRTWMIVSMVLFIYFLLSSWLESSSFTAYIPGFILCIFSWYVLWYLPRKNQRVGSCITAAGNHD